MKKIVFGTLCALSLFGGAAQARPWTVETIDSSGHAGQFSSLAVDAVGGLHICYFDSLNKDLRYAHFSGSAWNYTTVDTAGDVGRFCSVTVGTDNLPRTSYFDSTNRTLKYGVYNGTSWIVEVADPGPGVGQYTSIALDNTDHPSISYYDQANSNLMYATKPVSTWNRTTQDNAGTVGRFSSIAIGSGTKPRISYYSDDLKQLQYAYLKTGNWKLETPDPAINVGQYTSITVNASDVAFVAYIDSANGRLKRATRNGSWAVDIADSSGFAGGSTSIALDRTGNPVISYFDRIHDDLRVATYSGTVWANESVDTSGSIGLYSSCKVGPDSTIYIAYYDGTLGRLKLAHSVQPDTTPPGPPQGLTANGSNPSPWSKQPRFSINWTNPTDPSGIRQGLYKLGSAPTADFDTSGSLPATPPDSVTATASGGQTLYLWLVDSSGNTSYHNNSPVELRYDGSVPAVAVTYPTAGDTDVAVNTSISATFSEPMDPVTMTVAAFTVSGSVSGAHVATISYSDADSTVTLNPAVDFTFHETVTVTVKKEVTDRGGNAMAADKVWTFLTGSMNDTIPPGVPQSLTANGSNPSPWSNNPKFGLNWTNPPDSSGIGRSLYKLGTAPVSNYDTTGSLLGTPPDSATATAGSGQLLYLWLEDRAGNLQFQNNAAVMLRYDGTSPTGSTAASPLYSTAAAFTVNWSPGSDAGGSGLNDQYDIRVKDGTGPWTGWLTNYSGLSASYTGLDGHRYYFEAAAKDSAGNVEFFTTVPECSTLVDLTAPAVVTAFPAAGDTAVAVNTSISADFSEPMDAATMSTANVTVVGSVSGSHTLAIGYNGADSSVTINPAVDFSYHETVTVTIKKEVTDRAGNAMAADKVWTFLTGSVNDTVPPGIVHTVPDSAAVNVALNSWIRATFSEKVNPATVTSDKVLIRGSVNGIYPFWMSYSNADSTLNLSAYSNFAAFESVNVYIAPGIKDLAGNTTSNTLWWWFRTGSVPDTIPPRVTVIAMTPDTVWQTGSIALTATIVDNRKVSGAEYFIDAVGLNNTGHTVAPVDSFGAASVNIACAIITDTLGIGSHTVYLHGVDASGLWGSFDSLSFLKAGIDTIGPTFAIHISPALPSIGSTIAIAVTPSEPLHPDSAVACTLRSADGLVHAITLLRDSTRLVANVSTAGFVSGSYRLMVSGYDRWSNRGSSAVNFRLDATGSFLPDDLVYIWPNPARSGKVYFHYYVNTNAAVTAEVFNLEGRRIVRLSGRGEGGRPPHQTSSNAIVWDISGVASDVYVLRLSATSDANGEQRSVTKKFAIVK